MNQPLKPKAHLPHATQARYFPQYSFLYFFVRYIFLDPYALALPSPPMHHHQQHYQQQAQICSSHCNIHPLQYNQSLPPPPPPLAQQNSYYHHYNQPCTHHMQNYVPQPPTANCYQHHLPHSKSLDQYDGKIQGNGNINHHHRLSLDHNYKMAQQLHQQHLSPTAQQSMQQQQQQQQPPPPFDYIDSAYNHPYNQPNSRAPLPYNLSSNLGHDTGGYYPQDQPNPMANHHQRMFSTNEFYQQQLMQQLPTTVSDYHQPQQLQQQQPSYHHQKYSESSSPAIPDELISFTNEPIRVGSKTTEVKLRSSLKKSTHSTSDSVDMEQELNELRALKREKSLTPASTSSDVKTRDGIGNYQTWDYVFQNLEKDNEKKSKVSTADEKIAAELENLKIKANGHGPPRDRLSSNHKSNNRTLEKTGQTSTSVQTKHRTKSVSTTTDTQPVSNHEHKRTSSVMESNQRIQMPSPPQLIVGPNEWSCRFCTFLNPNTKKICEMCSKSKDFFFDADKNAATATCV